MVSWLEEGADEAAMEGAFGATSEVARESVASCCEEDMLPMRET